MSSSPPLFSTSADPEFPVPTSVPPISASSILPVTQRASTPPPPVLPQSSLSAPPPVIANDEPATGSTPDAVTQDMPIPLIPSTGDGNGDGSDEEADEASAPPMTLSASVVLTSIPKDSRVALSNAFGGGDGGDGMKVTIRLLSVGSTPSLRKNLFRLASSRKFAVVVNFLRKQLKLGPQPGASGSPSSSTVSTGAVAARGGTGSGESLFVYVNSTFAPSLDEEVGNLFKCFKREEELVVNYCLTPAFG